MNDYPLLNLFLTILWFFLLFAWIWVLISLLTDIFRSDDLSGWGKALWILFIIVLPFLGVLVYLIARGKSMQERTMKEASQREEAFQKYIRDSAGSGSGASTADELNKLSKLRDDGVISQQEFETQKARLLS